MEALTLPEDRPGAGSETSFADEARKSFELLDTLLDVLKAKLGDDQLIARIDLRYPTTVTLRTPSGDDEYHISDYDGVLYREVLQGKLMGVRSRRSVSATSTSTSSPAWPRASAVGSRERWLRTSR